MTDLFYVFTLYWWCAIISDKKRKVAIYGTERDHRQGHLPKDQENEPRGTYKVHSAVWWSVTRRTRQNNRSSDSWSRAEKIKGIGGKRLEEIMVVIERFLEE